MIEAISASTTGLSAAQTLLDVTSNNLANINTTGFKTAGVGFQDGVAVASTDRSFAQGPLQSTGNPLDVAIQGNGFFQVVRPDGSAAFTRDGSFRLDATGRLVTADGSLVQPPITVPPGTTSITVGADGTVTAAVGGSSQVLGRLTLVQFPNAPGLIGLGGNLYAASAASGSPAAAVPGQGGTGTLVQGFVEGSNVNPTTELVNLLIAQQTFVANSQAIIASNQMLTDTVGLVS